VPPDNPTSFGNHTLAEDGPTVFAHARRLGAEGIVSKKVDGAYQSGPCRVWIKVRNPARIAVQAGAQRDLGSAILEPIRQIKAKTEFALKVGSVT
jgi:ATP-dependent DNA ligase